MNNLIFLILLVSLQSLSQTINFKGQLLDNETKRPVVYANISFLKVNKGISSLENGIFNIEIDEKLLKEKVHISCLNYKDTIVFANKMQNKTLYLKPKSFELEEVIISKKVDRELTIDKYRRKDIKSGFEGSQSSPWIITKYFEYKDEYEKNPFLKEVWVYFGAMILRKKSKFRIRFYKKDIKTGQPSEDLIKENIIAFSKKINGKIKVDIAKYDIEFPKEGFFIGLERIHIPYNFYEYKYTIKGSKKKYLKKAVAPSFGATYTQDTIFVFSSGKWRKFYIPQKFYERNQIQPAISLTLSN